MQNPAENLDPPQEQVEVTADPVTVAAETPEVDKPQEVQPEKLVRLEALHEERSKRKELAKKVESLERQQASERAVLNDRLQQLYAMQQPQPQVDLNDPIAVHDHALRMQGQELAQYRQERQQNYQVQMQHQQTQQLVNWARSEASTFAKETPDFQDAYQHVAKQRLAMIQATGVPAEEAQQRLANDEIWVYSEAYRTGRNPAEVIYEMAKNTGYKGKAGEQKMTALQNGVKASANLGPGGASSENPTPEQIANMSEEAFATFKASLKKKGKSLSDAL